MVLNEPARRASDAKPKVVLSPSDKRVLQSFENFFQPALTKAIAAKEKLSSTICFNHFHLVMASMAEALNQAYATQNICLKAGELPGNIDDMMRQALGNDCVKRGTQSFAEHAAIMKLQNEIEPKAGATFGQHKSLPVDSPFAAIDPGKLWRLSIEAAIVSPLETQFGFDSANVLLPNVFENEKTYLHNMGKARQFSAENRHRRVDQSLILDLHDACLPRGTGKLSQFDTPGSSFALDLGGNMTMAGREELRALEKEVKVHVPNYKVMVDLADASEMRVERPAGPPHNMTPLIDRWLKEYNPDKIEHSEQRLFDIVTLCQKLERLHPFVDGNARTFGVHLLNHLLIQNGFDVTALFDPNILDGHSTAEVVQAVKEGQVRAAGWRLVPPAPSNQGRGLQSQLMARLPAGQ